MSTEEGASGPVKLPDQVRAELLKLVWGATPACEVFQRWSQGFLFSADEPTALVQLSGGPCPVIAPVQAFLLKHAMGATGDDWRNVPRETCNQYLLSALCDILDQCNCPAFVLAAVEPSSQASDASRTSAGESASSSEENPQEDNITNFHNRLRCSNFDSLNALRTFLEKNISTLMEEYGVLLFFYSVILSKGIDEIKKEMGDANEALIVEAHGYGCQSLINLLLTGKAVPYVWDNDKDVGGMTLEGIHRKSEIGYLTLLEHLRYCEVGFNLKSPQQPIWLLGSETHLTVAFSKNPVLVAPETPDEIAKRIFKQYDPEGNNFIASALLKDVLADLNLYSENEYVELMKQRLDSEGLGVILLSNFMEEFFPSQAGSDSQIDFILYHYNGLTQAATDGRVRYAIGRAVLALTPMEAEKDPPPVLKCLRTKWAHLDVEWEGSVPSIN